MLIFYYFRDKLIRAPENPGCPRRRTCWQSKGKSRWSQSSGRKDKRLGRKLLKSTAWPISHIYRLQENTGWGEAKCIQGTAQRYERFIWQSISFLNTSFNPQRIKLKSTALQNAPRPQTTPSSMSIKCLLRPPIHTRSLRQQLFVFCTPVVSIIHQHTSSCLGPGGQGHRSHRTRRRTPTFAKWKHGTEKANQRLFFHRECQEEVGNKSWDFRTKG